MTKRHGTPNLQPTNPTPRRPLPAALLLAAAGVLVIIGVTFVAVQVIIRVLPVAGGD